MHVPRNTAVAAPVVPMVLTPVACESGDLSRLTLEDVSSFARGWELHAEQRASLALPMGPSAEEHAGGRTLVALGVRPSFDPPCPEADRFRVRRGWCIAQSEDVEDERVPPADRAVSEGPWGGERRRWAARAQLSRPVLVHDRGPIPPTGFGKCDGDAVTRERKCEPGARWLQPFVPGDDI